MKSMVSFSGGKDSTAMLLRLIELDDSVDAIAFADTGFEFPELYDYIKKIEETIERKVKVLKPNKDFKEWFYGIPEKGERHELGLQRGFPVEIGYCWWTREAKITPLKRFQKKYDNVYVGIAYDERERMSEEDNNISYPLVKWKWSEQDCVNYLNEKGLLNPLYVNFNRLGCWFCPKQGIGSLYVLWKNYPDLWEKFKWWDNEQFKINGRYIKSASIESYEKLFEQGKTPAKLPKYDCWNGCESVKRAFQSRQMVLGQC